MNKYIDMHGQQNIKKKSSMFVFEYTTLSYTVKRDHAFYGNRVFVILLTRARH